MTRSRRASAPGVAASCARWTPCCCTARPGRTGESELMGAPRRDTTVPADLRELVILRIAVLNAAPYEWDSHQEPARLAGLDDRQLAAVCPGDAGAARRDRS